MHRKIVRSRRKIAECMAIVARDAEAKYDRIIASQHKNKPFSPETALELKKLSETSMEFHIEESRHLFLGRICGDRVLCIS